jgi:6-phosphogluconolactonase
MGPDGHTASLFPGTKALEERERWVVPNWVPQLDTWRMTLTYPVLNAAREALFVVTRADKREAFEKIRAGSTELPAGRVSSQRTTWIVDRACVSDPAPELEAAGA